MEKEDEQKSGKEQPEGERKFSQQQYDLLKSCSDKEDMTEWNQWRKEHLFEEIRLQGANLSGTHLENAYLWAANLENANLRGAHLEEVNLGDAHLENADLQHAHLEKAYLLYAYLKNAELSDAHLENAILWGAHLENAKLWYAQLEKAMLEGAHLENAELNNAHLESALLNGTHLENANLMFAHLENATLSRAHLENANLWYSHLKNANLSHTHLENADLDDTNLENADLSHTHLENAKLRRANLKGAEFDHTSLEGARFVNAIVDGNTLFEECELNRKTDFRRVGLDTARIGPATKQLFEYNSRRMNWEEWYKEHWLLQWPVKLFWSFSDYGISTWRIIGWFFLLALAFAAIYANCACWWPPGIVNNLDVEPHLPLWHYFLLVLLRPVYFSIVTMTTLGFGDMHANETSIWGHVLLTFQVILGYVLLGALVTRFAVLFTAGGPAGKFSPTKTKEIAEGN